MKDIVWVSLSPGTVEHLESGFQIRYELHEGFPVWVGYSPLSKEKFGYHTFLEKVKESLEKAIREYYSTVSDDSLYQPTHDLLTKIIGDVRAGRPPNDDGGVTV